MKVLRLIDLPPVWLAVFIAAVWVIDQLFAWGLFGPLGQIAGAGLVVAGALLMAVAAGQMMLARTTVIPRHTPRNLVTTGVFRWSRNPIYLADAMILTGAVLWWDVPVALPLVAGFMLLIHTRFILQEEAVLQTMFGEAFPKWAATTGRWFGR